MKKGNPSVPEIKDILTNARRIAVVGLSDKPNRASYEVSRYMQQAGYEIIPVNPRVEEVLGVKAVSSLEAIEDPVDIVNVFRRSEQTPPIAEEAVQIGARVLWLQLGIENDEAYRIANEGGLKVVMDHCIKVDHARFL